MEKESVNRFHKRKRSSSNPVQNHTRRRFTTIEYEYISLRQPLLEDEEEEPEEYVAEKEEEEDPEEYVVEKEEEEEEEDPEEEKDEEKEEEEEEEDPEEYVEKKEEEEEEEEEDPEEYVVEKEEEPVEEEEEGKGCEIELEDYVHCQGSADHYEDDGEENSMEDDEATSKFNGIDPISATLSDPKVLDCCSCCQPLTIPVFQCENGHFACFTCCALGRECLECSSRIPYNRCRAIEKVLESINISCLNAKYGWKETLSYSERNNHEKKCIYIPCFCPHKGCDFVASSKELSLHFSNKHKTPGIQFLYNHSFHVSVNPYDEFLILQEQTDGNLFILNNNVVENMGNMVTISCMGPNFSQPGNAYAIVAKSQGCCLMLKSFTKNIQRGTSDIPSSGFLVIPFDRFGYYAFLHLEICIRRR